MSRELVDAVLAHFMETHEPATVKQLAARLGWPESRVRTQADRTFDADRGWVRICPETTYVARHERSYGSQIGSVKAVAYGPTREYLCRLLQQARAAVNPEGVEERRDMRAGIDPGNADDGGSK